MRIFKKIIATLLVVVMCLTSAPMQGFVGMELPSLPEINFGEFELPDIDFSSWFGSKASATDTLAPTGQCGDNVYWSFNVSTGELVISGTGSMTDYSGTGSPFYDSNIKSVIIESGITTIGNETFGNCYSLLSVTIPDSVVSIGKSAFLGCYNIDSVFISDIDRWLSIEFNDYASNPMCGGADLYLNNKLVNSLTLLNETTDIGDYAFQGCTSLEKVVIGDSVEKIGIRAFYWCENITSITVGIGVKYIGESAFSECYSIDSVFISDVENWLKIEFVNIYSNPTLYGGTLYLNNKLITEVIIPEGLTTIGYGVFGGCVGLKSVSIPNSVTSIGDYAFQGCTSLSSIIIPDSVSSIGDYAFYKCTSLTKIDIPNNVTKIGYNAFRDCSNLMEIDISDSLISIGEGTFVNTGYYKDETNWENGMLYIDDCLVDAHYTTGDCIVKDGTYLIGDYAFSSCERITSVSIPDSVEFIGCGAFYRCVGLKRVVMSEKITFIGDNIFGGCTSFEFIKIPDGVTSIGDDSFQNCTSLTNIEIPDSVLNIGESVFRNCYGLKSIKIPASVEYQESSFSGCTGLTNITISKGTGKMTRYTDDTYEVTPWYSSKSNELSVIIEDGVENISNYAFSNCVSLKNLKIPNSVTEVGRHAFMGCINLQNINIPNSVTSIGDYAFLECKNLSNLVISEGVIDIGTKAFSNCSSLEVLRIPDSVTNLGYEAFYSCRNIVELIIPASIEEANHSFLMCDNITNLTISKGSGNMTKFGNYTSVPWYHIKDSVTDIEIEDGIKNISDYAFYDFNVISSIEIPNSVTEIGENAFYNCANLESVVLSKNTTTIGYNAFGNCSNLSGIIIPNSVTSIGAYAFSGCTSLINIDIPNSVTSVDDGVFGGCTNLKNVGLTNSTNKISNRMFSGCSSLSHIVIPDSIISIGGAAFSDCTSLTSIDLPNSVTQIGAYAFSNCSELIDIVIPESVTEIGSKAFSNCINLENLEMPMSLDLMPLGVEDVFYNCKNISSITFSNGTGYMVSYSKNELKNTPWYQSDSDQLTITFKEGVDTASFYNFSECDNLTCINIPSSVTVINGDYFDCESLIEINVDRNNEYYSSDQGVLFNKTNTKIIKYCAGKTESSYEISKGVSEIGYNSFCNCDNLTSITIPNCVLNIQRQAFYGCKNLKDVYYEGSIEEWKKIKIGSYNTELTNAIIHCSDGNINGSGVSDFTGEISGILTAWDGLGNSPKAYIDGFGYYVVDNDLLYDILDAYRTKKVICQVEDGIIVSCEPLFSEEDDEPLKFSSFKNECFVGEYVNYIDLIYQSNETNIDNFDVSEISFSVSNPDIIDFIGVDSGVIREKNSILIYCDLFGKKAGSTVLTATLPDGTSASCIILVKQSNELYFNINYADYYYADNFFFYESGDLMGEAIQLDFWFRNTLISECYIDVEDSEVKNYLTLNNVKIKFQIEDDDFAFSPSGSKECIFEYDVAKFDELYNDVLRIYCIDKEATNVFYGKKLKINILIYFDDPEFDENLEQGKDSFEFSVQSYKMKYVEEHINAMTDNGEYKNIVTNSFAEGMIGLEDEFEFLWWNMMSKSFTDNAISLFSDFNEVNGYEIVIADILSILNSSNKEEQSQMFAEAFFDFCSSVFEALVGFYSENYINDVFEALGGEKGKFTLKEITDIIANKTTSGPAYEAFEKLISNDEWTNTLNNIAKVGKLANTALVAYGVIKDTVKGMQKAAAITSACNAYEEMLKNNMDIFKKLQAKANANGNDDLAEALGNYINYENSSAGEKIANTIAATIVNGGGSVVQVGVMALAKAVAQGAVERVVGVIGSVISGFECGRLLSNLLCNSSDYAEASCAVVSAGHIAKSLRDVIIDMTNEICVDVGTNKNAFNKAQQLDFALNMFKAVETLAYNKTVDGLNARGSSVIGGFLSKDKKQEQKNVISGLLVDKASLESVECHNTKLSKIYSKICGDFANDWMSGDTDEGVTLPSFKIICVQCPVDVLVTNSKGEVVAQIINDEIVSQVEGIEIVVYGDEKYIRVPDTDEYNIIITATDAGKMDYTVFEYNENGDNIREVEYSNIPLYNGQKFTGKVDKLNLAKSDSYNLTTDSKTIYADKDEYLLSEGHKYTASIINATCTENGKRVYTCTCGDTYTETIEAVGHDFNGTKCKNCDYDKADGCPCKCHKGGIAGFFFKIILFFQKIFKSNKDCKCGKLHY